MNRYRFSEQGQSMLLMVFGLIVLLIMVGLAVDGGTAYLERRRMQNAADAGSLAGTRLLAEAICGDPAATDAAIRQEIEYYGQINGVQDPANDIVAKYVGFASADATELTELGTVGSGSIPNGAAAIQTETAITRSTYFMQLAGIASSHAGAGALAVTGPPLIGGGLRPIGVPLQLVTDLDPNDPANNEFSIDLKNPGSDNDPGSISWGGNTEQHKGWMNLGYAWNVGENPGFPRANYDMGDDTTSANIIRGWMENGWNGTLYGGDFVHAAPGAKSTAVCAAPEEELIYVPVYDAIPECATQVGDPKPNCPTQGGGFVYHIVGFVGVKVKTNGCNQGQGTIEFELVESILGEGVPNPSAITSYGGTKACQTHTMVVVLQQ